MGRNSKRKTNLLQLKRKTSRDVKLECQSIGDDEEENEENHDENDQKAVSLMATRREDVVSDAVLEWRDSDQVDDVGNKCLHERVNRDCIRRSMRASAYCERLEGDIRDLRAVHVAALGGAVIRAAPSISAVTPITGTDTGDTGQAGVAMNTIEEVTETTGDDQVVTSTRAVTLDTSAGEEVLPDNKSDSPSTSPVQKLRRSGRSVFKINYLELINIQICEPKKPSDNHDNISPRKKSKPKITKSSARSSLSETVDVDLNSEKKVPEVIKNEEVINSPTTLDDKNVAEGENVEDTSAKDESIPDKQEKEVISDMSIDETSFIEQNNEQEDIKNDLQSVLIEQNDHVEERAVIEDCESDVLQEATESASCQDQEKIKDISDEEVKEEEEEVNEEPKIEDVNEEVVMLNHEEADVNEESNNEAFETPKSPVESLVNEPMKSQIIRLSSKRIDSPCIICKRPTFINRVFVNLCHKCSIRTRKHFNRLILSGAFSCIDEPPCWSRPDERHLCDACVIQNLIERGLKWTPEFKHLSLMTLEQMRSPQAVIETRKRFIFEGEKFLMTVKNLESNETCSTCRLPVDEPKSTPCKWDIRFFSKASTNSVYMCAICKVRTTDHKQVYIILPKKEEKVCHICLLFAYDAYNSNTNEPRRSCEPVCGSPRSCSQCLLAKIETLVPLNAIKYRYFDGDHNPSKLCELCLRKDSSKITILRTHNNLCLVCVWRIKIHFLLGIGPCKSEGSCLISQCSACLIELAQSVLDIHCVLTHVPDPHKNPLKPLAAVKRPAPINHLRVSKPKKKKVQTAEENQQVQNNTGDNRPKRTIKSSQFHDYIVDSKCFLKSTTDRKVQKSFGFERKFEDNYSSNYKLLNDSNESMEDCTREETLVDTSNETVESRENQETENEEKENKTEEIVTPDNECKIESTTNHEDEMSRNNGKKIEENFVNGTNSMVWSIQPLSRDVIDDSKREETTKSARRLKRAFSPVSLMNGKKESPSAVRNSGPRVKQVSRQNVNADVNLDAVRQKCVVKRTSRMIKNPDSSVVDQSEQKPQEINDMKRSLTRKTTNDLLAKPVIPKSQNSKCGVCIPCLRTKGCGTCPPCLFNKTRKRRIKECLNRICVLSEDYPGEAKPVENTAEKSASKKNDVPKEPPKTTETKPEDIMPTRSNLKKNNNINFVSEVFRDSDVDALSSEEDPDLDPDIDSIQTVKGDTITPSMAQEGGFAVITSFKAQPNKVLCFSCGSGGDQLIHCVSCAEPFHFFCIEYQFRPKSKELYVCRNCTKCSACDGYGSDLKCIKCQLGYHPKCVDRYPPSRSEDRSNWACYKCAMCLHCGAKAEDFMSTPGKSASPIDWSKDPWQCGRCARARKDGLVCPECGRAYQSCLETLECGKCLRMVHRQCSGLTEDEYEIFKDGSKSVNNESISFNCSKCTPGIEDEAKKRVRLKRQCKDSGLKKYCERGVAKKMNEFIVKGGEQEEMLLEQNSLSDVSGGFRGTMHNQVDGVDDDSETERSSDTKSITIQGVGERKQMSSLSEMKDDYETLASSSPMPVEMFDRDMNQTSSTLCNSSESIEEFDVDQLNAVLEMESQSVNRVDLDSGDPDSIIPQHAKINIFGRLIQSDFLSPRHLIMEVLARILIKLSRYHSRSQVSRIYNKLLEDIECLCHDIFPWIDFVLCLETVQGICKRNSGRMKLVLQSIADSIKDCINREVDVFSSSISDIEEKLRQSFQRGREEFIMYHSEQHLSALVKYLESTTQEQDHYVTYRLGFEFKGNNTICEKDVRCCALCGYSGDDGLEGRLIYGGHDVWVHVNCALWSDEVYEKEDGALVNVEAAIKRGETSICSSCNNFGATVRCSAEDSLDGYGDCCQNVYHFGCAYNLLRDPVFTESRTFYCSDLHESLTEEEQQLSLADMLILRRIYLPQGCLGKVSAACSKNLPSMDIVVTIGTLRINCLGTIDAYADCYKTVLCPLNYEARRLFWSITDADTLVMYYMTIDREYVKNRPVDEIVTQYVPTTTAAATPLKHKRRIIESVDSRNTKRLKTADYNQKTVYEMDEDGNLQPLSIFNRTKSTESMIRKYLLESQPPADNSKKVNRRFPMNSKTNTMVESNQSDFTQESPSRLIETLNLVADSQSPHSYQLSLSAFQSQRASSFQSKLPQPLQRSPTPPQPSPSTQSVLSSRIHVSSSSFPEYQQKFLQNVVHINQKKVTEQQVPKQLQCQYQRAQHSSQISSTPLRISGNSSVPQVIPVSQMTRNPSRISQPIQSRPSTSVKPPNIINVPSSVLKPVSSIMNHSQINKMRTPSIIRVTPTETSQGINKVLKVVKIQTPPNEQPRISNSSGNTPSVLRNVLTGVREPISSGPVLNNQSPYIISSCGSLLSLKDCQQLPQYDGEADDTCSLITTDGFQHQSSANSVCSDQEFNLTNNVWKNGCDSRGLCVRFIIRGFKFTKSPKQVWTFLERKVIQLRRSNGLPDYPIKTSDGWSKFGLDHRFVTYLLEQLPNIHTCTSYEFQFCKTRAQKLRDYVTKTKTQTIGSARTTPYSDSRPAHLAHDPLAFLLSCANKPPRNHAPIDKTEIENDSPEPNDNYLERLASQFRNLSRGRRCREKDVQVCVSPIHGRGLFARRQFQPHDIIIEYVGELIRATLSDVREAAYQKTGVDCYMFRLDQDIIVDATRKGNAARFINHSCNPNCYAKVVRFEGEKHIIIIAQRIIHKGEEVTYNYRFPIEDDKLPCSCGSSSCKKYLN